MSKISAYATVTAVVNTTDYVPVVRDNGDGTFTNKKISTVDLKSANAGLGGISDVLLSGTILDGQALVYELSSGKWKNKASGGVPTGGTVGQTLVKQSSVDGAAVWAGVGNTTGNPAAGAHRYWRIQYVSGNHGTYLSAFDIQFRQTAGTTEHPTGGTILETNTRAGFAGTDAFDGSDATRWALDSYANIGTATLGYYYATAISVAQVRMFVNNGETPNSYNIQYSDNGTAWTTALAVTGQTNWATEVLHAMPLTTVYGLSVPVSGLSDALIATPTDGQVLTYEAATSKWKNKAAAGGSGGTGSATLGPVYEFGDFAPPAASMFTSVAATGVTVTMTDASRKGLSVATVGGSGGDNMYYALRDVSTWGTAWKVRTRVKNSLISGSYPATGLGIYDSATQKAMLITAQNEGTVGTIQLNQRANLTTFAANVASYASNHPPLWYEVERAGTAMYYRYSWDGVIFHTYTSTTTAYLAAITHVCVGGPAYSNSTPDQIAGFLCTYWDDPVSTAASRTIGGGGGSPTAAAAHVLANVLTYSKNCTMTNPATGVYKFTFTTPIPAHCVPTAAATFNNDAADDTGMYCSFSRNTSQSADVTWVNSIIVMTRRHTDGSLLQPQNLRLLMTNPEF